MANSIAETLQTAFNKLPSTLQGNGQNFIYLLKDTLKDLTGELQDKFEEISKIANSITDAPDTMTSQLKNCKVTEKRVDTAITLTLTWDYSAIENYDSAEIYVKESTSESVDWSTIDISKTIATPKTSSYVLDGCNAGTTYQFTFLGKNTYGSVSVKSSAPTLVYTISAMNNVPDPPTEFNAYTTKNGVLWKWKQPVDIDYSVSELRIDTNVGSTTGLLEITQDCSSTVQPTSREGTAYLYNKGYGSKYSEPLTVTWSKPVPTAPQGLAITTTYQGLQITYGTIPDNCIGIVLYINGIKHYTSDASFNYYCSTGSYTVKAAYYDSFGEGTLCDAVTVGTLEEIPSDAVHITNQTVFDDGVIVGKYIGDHEVVGTKIKDGTITTDNIAAGTITANNIGSNAITTDKLNANAVTADKISTSAITTEKLASGAITTDKLAAGSVSADKLTANTINMAGALKIVGGNVTLDENGLTEKELNGSTVTFGSSGMIYKDSNGYQFNMVGKQIIGSATNGQTVTFKHAWDETPNVVIIPKEVCVQSPSYQAQTVQLHAYADNITTSGFKVHCYSGIANGSGNYSPHTDELAWSQLIDTTDDHGNWRYSTTKNFSIAIPSNISTLSLTFNPSCNWTGYEERVGGLQLYVKYDFYLYKNGTQIDYQEFWNGKVYDGEAGGDPQSGDVTVLTPLNISSTHSGSYAVTGTDTITGKIVVSISWSSSGGINQSTFTGNCYLDALNYNVSGEQVLDGSGTAVFIVTDKNNSANYTLS